MNTRIALIAGACVLALSACNRTPPAETTPPPATTVTPPMEAPAPASTMAPATPSTMAPATPSTMGMPAGASTMAAPAAAGTKPAATVSNCATSIEGNDQMQYNVGSIAVPASCSKFTINLKHVGKMPVAAMGHNVVIAKESDMQGIDADGASAGVANNYIKAGDTRVIAHTKLVGGGESTSVSFDTSRIKSGGPFVFFCSFPGHAAMMKGSISVQ